MTAVYRSRTGSNSLGETIASGATGDVLDRAHDAFTAGLHVAAGITAAALAVMAILLAVTLRALPALSRR